MASYILLINFTEQGVHNISDSPNRAIAAVALGKKMGVKAKEIYWCLGAHDGALIAEARNDETMTAYALSIASFGNVRTQTLRAFKGAEFKSILGKVRQG